MQPGVYIYKDKDGNVIYVGKAKLLRNRMRSYFQSQQNLHPKVKALMARVADFDFIVTGSEMEALLLENNLIKAYQPRYNIHLRDDKTYPYLKITTGETYPRLAVVREEKDGISRYFGPYTDAGSLREIVRLLNSIFPMRTCKTLIKRERPCLNRDLGRCLGPCTGDVDPGEYRRMVAGLTALMEGSYEELVEVTEAKMKAAAQQQEYEKAARLRDQAQSIRILGQRQQVLLENSHDMDVIAVLVLDQNALALLFRIRAGKLVAKDSFWFTRMMEEPVEEIVEFLLKQHYEDQADIPAEILVNHLPANHKLLTEWIRGQCGHRVELKVPARGEKRRLMEMVENNALLFIQEKQSYKERQEKILIHLSRVIELEVLPERIECFDISHLGGAETVASMVVFKQGVPDKHSYRRFKIRVDQNDDYLSMAEVLERRFQEAMQGNPKFLPEPDLLLIDGGIGQLSAAYKVLEKMGRQIPVISLAKKREEIFLPNRAEAIRLPRRDEGLQLLQRLRDEAHRFAISYNRQRRAKTTTNSALDRIEGIGDQRKKALLRHFGSVSKIRAASPEEIAAVPGISIKLARNILDSLGKHP